MGAAAADGGAVGRSTFSRVLENKSLGPANYAAAAAGKATPPSFLSSFSPSFSSSSVSLSEEASTHSFYGSSLDGPEMRQSSGLGGI